MALPRGVRQKNPGNLRYPGAKHFLGCTGGVDGYAVFDTAQHGIRAMALNLLGYYREHELDTERGILARWAPGADGNNEAAYLKFVAGRTTWGADEHLKIDSPSVLLALMKAMIAYENSQQPYTEAVLKEGINEALGAEQ